MPTERNPQILNASTNLLGICFVIITGLKLTGSNPKSYADEVAWAATACFLTSTVLSYLALDHEDAENRVHRWSHRAFLAGLAALSISVFVAAATLPM